MTEDTIYYAGFWRRFWALMIDTFIILAVMHIFWAFHSLTQILRAAFQGSDVGEEWDTMTTIWSEFFSLDVMVRTGNELWMVWVGFLMWLLYASLFEACKWQATPGKKCLSIKVIDYQGERLDFPQAVIRNFAKLLSEITFGLGYVLAGITKHKQALHDMLAKTLIIQES